jgi:hypothetical protein
MADISPPPEIQSFLRIVPKRTIQIARPNNILEGNLKDLFWKWGCTIVGTSKLMLSKKLYHKFNCTQGSKKYKKKPSRKPVPSPKQPKQTLIPNSLAK